MLLTQGHLHELPRPHVALETSHFASSVSAADTSKMASVDLRGIKSIFVDVIFVYILYTVCHHHISEIPCEYLSIY